MRIVDKRKDYYDCVQSCSQDRSVVYVRTEEEIYYDNSWPLPYLSYHSYVPGLTDFHIIGFCGNLYPCIEMHTPYGHEYPPKKVFCYTMDELDRFIRGSLKDRDLDVYDGKAKSKRWSWNSISHKREFERFFENMRREISTDRFREMFIEKRSPVFTARRSGRWGGGTITWNGMLRPFDFMKVFDPYTAFQEIQMFMNNLAAPEKEMPVIPDEIKAESKGFDKWSFRRPPGG